jgi:hypothetical protein
MSFLSALKKVGTSIVKTANIVNPLNFNPIQKARQGIEIVTNKTIAPSKAEKRINTTIAVPVGATIGGLVGGPVGAVKGALILPTLTTAVQESPMISKFVSTQATNLLTGKTQQTAGSIIGNIAEGNILPKDLTGKDIRNIALGVGGAGLVVGAGTLAYDYLKDKKDKGEAIIGENNISKNLSANPTELGTPTTIPERETTNLSSTRKRYKRTQKKQTPNIRINNAIAINNTTNGLKITNKRYIKELAY